MQASGRAMIAAAAFIIKSLGLPEARTPRTQSGDVPPEAYGIFKNTNDPTFLKVLLVETTRVSVTITVMLRGRPLSNPMTCRSQILGKITPSMQLNLLCRGESIPYKLAFRRSSETWVVTEDASTPAIYSRNR
jgi:hypothetical protein